jgi:serine/threonine protein kinase/tetratricopeptide (TPR) repeat protein
MSIDPQRLKELFLTAAEIEAPAERAAFLDRECGQDAELRRKLEALLHAHDDSGGFLKPGPTSDPTPTGDEAPHAETSDAPGDVIGPYKLLQKLGEGGMGTVWVAEQQQPVKRRVALKLIKPGMDSAQVLRRFEQERQALALMDHTSIAKVFDAGTTTQGRPYFVMELVKGVPITKYCDELNLPIRERLTLFVPVCQAIQHAHQKGIIHRDIKPSNVLVCMQDGKPVPKIIDFGIAKAISQQLTDASLYTEVGQVIGTLEYMSPEQAELSALDIDTRADVYALGAMLYELLTGTTPLDRRRLKQAALMELLRLIKEQEPPRPSTRLSESKETLPSIAAQRHTEPARLLKEVRGELDWIVMKCLEKDRTRRYETANGLARDIERYLADEPVEACPPSRSYRLGKFARKHRAELTAAAAFVLLLAIAATVSTGLAVWARRAEGLAETRLEEVSQEKARADEETRIATAINEFFQGLLSQADISNQPLLAGGAAERNPNVTVKELLDRAADDIEGKFAGQPVTEASIRLTMGDAYRALGDYVKAQQHLERAVQLRTAELGADHPDTLRSKNSLALLYRAQGQYAKAERLFKKALEEFTSKLGADHPNTLSTKNNLALMYWTQGQYTKAESLYKEVLEVRTAQLGADHIETLASKNNMAALYLYQGQYTKAEPLFKDVLEGHTAKLGADHPDTLTAKNNLATLYKTRGQHTKAESLFKQVLEVRAAKLGADHPDTLGTKNNLASLYWVQGQYGKAEQLFQEVLELSTAKLGADHPLTLSAKDSLAVQYLAQGQYTKAEPLFKEVLKVITARLGADHPDTLTTKNNLASLYRQQGQYTKAEPLFKQVLEVSTVKLGADHPSTLTAKNNLALLYLNQEQYAKAEPLFKDVLIVFTTKVGSDHPHTLTIKDNLAGVYRARGQYTQAEPLLQEAVDGARKKLGLTYPITRTVIDHLADSYERLNTPAKAEPLRRELVEFWKQKAGTDSIEYAGPLVLLGLNLLLQHKADDAEPILRDCLAIRQKKQSDLWTTFNTQSLLGGALLGQKKYADAEPLLLKGYQGMKDREAKIPANGNIRLTDALQRLVQLYEATGNKDEAAKWCKELQNLQAKKPGGTP